MFSRGKRYIYDEDSIQIHELKESIGHKIMAIGKSAIICISIAFILLFIMYKYSETPFTSIYKNKLKHLEIVYNDMEGQLERLENKFAVSFPANDKIYREVLEMDALTDEERLAGIGGYETKLFENVNFSKGISHYYKSIQARVKVQEESFKNISKQANIFDKLHDCIPGIQPVKPAYNIWFSSAFGYRSDPMSHRLKKHNGVDWAGPIGTKIYASADGIVTLVKTSRKGYGNEVVIDHGFGYTTRYAHLHSIAVENGQKVKRGENIGTLGNSGRSTGPHLHYEVRLNKKPLDPMLFYADDLTCEEYDLITGQSAGE